MVEEGRVGQSIAQDGSVEEIRLGRYRSQAVMDAHAHWWDAVSRGNCFTAATATTPVSLGTALTATAVTFTLFNPIGSSRNLVVMQTQVGFVNNALSGTVWYAANNTQGQAAPTAVTAIAVNNLLLGGGAMPIAKAYSACTLPATPTAVRLLLALPSSTAFNSPTYVVDNVDGGLILTPGMAVTLQGIGTNALLGFISMQWEEVLP